MNKQKKFYPHCTACGAALRSEKRLQNHKENRCNEKRYWRGRHNPKNKDDRNQ